MMKQAGLLALLLIMSPAVLLGADHAAAKAANGVVSSSTQRDGVLLKLNVGLLKLRPCEDDLIRVTYTPTNAFSSRASLMVNRAFEAIPSFNVTESAAAITLTTARLKAVIERATGAISYYDASNRLLCQERSDGRKATPVTYDDDSGYQLTQIFTITNSEGLYGLGGYQSGGVNRQGQRLELKQENALAIAVPFLISTNGYGILWDNDSRTNFGATIKRDMSFVSAIGDQIDYYFIYGPEFDTLIARYRETTGKAPLYPKWAYGFFQSRERYKSQAELLDVAQSFRSKQIPLDCIVQDWQYWGDLRWNALKFDPEIFPVPAAMARKLHDQNLKLMVSIWSNFGKKTEVSQAMDAKGFLLQGSERSFPGGACYYDAYNPQAGKLYWDHINSGLFSKGVDAWWMDSPEPSTGVVKWGNCALGSLRRYANTYPLMTNTNVYRAQRSATSDKRVYILTRSAFAGSQRNAATIWSGDIDAGWDVFKQQLACGLDLCAAGVPYFTTDIGAFYIKQFSGGNANPEYRELYTRWFEWGAFNPIFRSHGTKTPREMWFFGEAGTPYFDAQLKFDKLRYRLLPYIYSLGWKVTDQDYTMMRVLPFDFRSDVRTYNIDDQYMFGDFLVAPVYAYQAKSRSVYLPAGTRWYDFWTGSSYAGGQAISAAAPIDIMPLYVKAGSIIPMGPHIQYAAQASDPIELRIYRGASGSFNLYEDEGDNYDYEKGAYSIIPFSYDEATKQLTIGARKGTFAGMPSSHTFHIVWVDQGSGVGLEPSSGSQETVNYNGSAVVVHCNAAATTKAQ